MSIAKERFPDAALAECPVSIDYVNWRGERSLRRIVPRRLFVGEVEWHDGRQWLLDAWDVDKGAERTFAMKDVLSWSAD